MNFRSNPPNLERILLFPFFEVIIRIITSKEFDYNPKAVGLRVIYVFYMIEILTFL